MLAEDAFFENVCELDLVFNFYKVRNDKFYWLASVIFIMKFIGLCDPGRNIPR